LIVGKIRFQSCLGIFQVAGCRTVVSLGAVSRELRDGDGCQDADDRYNDQELDEGETFPVSNLV